jgi:type I restriction enzyme M protein
VNNSYDLSINKYKRSTYVENIYPHPKEILAEINGLEAEIQSGINELEALISE